MTAADIAAALAGKPVRPGACGNFLVPCPAHDDRQPSLSLKDGNDALLVHCFAGCDPRDILAALRHRGLVADRDGRPRRRRKPTPAPVPLGRPPLGRGELFPLETIPARSLLMVPLARDDGDYEERQHEKARWLWSQRRPIVGTVAEKYLRGVRGITGPLPPTLGFLPPRKPTHYPAMIAAFALVPEIEPGVLDVPGGVDAVHLTLLAPDGSGKADAEPNKLIVGRPLGKPIVLAPINDGLGLAICEGIEDALSAHAATGLGAWAAGSASFLSSLAVNVPSYVESVTIYQHDDDNDAGRRGAFALADTLIERGIEVLIEMGPR